MWNKIQRIYVGTSQVYPVVYCDFTQSDYWFNLYGKSSTVTVGRDSNWLYAQNTWTTYQVAAWSIPQTIYSKWVPLKIEMTWKNTVAKCWLWISVWTDTKFIRTWINWLNKKISTEDTINLQNNIPSNTEYTLTIDFAGKKQYISTEPWTTQAITDTEIATINSDRANGSWNICAMLTNTRNAYSYIKTVKFYF